jgi:hypothetical protein
MQVAKKARTEASAAPKKDMRAFAGAYRSLANEGKCDSFGGCQCERVRDEWSAYTGPVPVREFIEWRANSVRSIQDEREPPVEAAPAAPAAPIEVAAAAAPAPVEVDTRIPVADLEALRPHEEDAIVRRINEKHLGELNMRGPVTGAAPKEVFLCKGALAGLVEIRFDPKEDPDIMFPTSRLLKYIQADLVARICRVQLKRK